MSFACIKWTHHSALMADISFTRNPTFTHIIYYTWPPPLLKTWSISVAGKIVEKRKIKCKKISNALKHPLFTYRMHNLSRFEEFYL